MFCFSLSAQSGLQSDPDIEWIGAFTADYRFDPAMPEPPFEWSWDWNWVTVEKLLMPPLPSGFPSASDATELFLKIRFWEALRSMDCACFEDPQLQTPLPEGEAYSRLSTLDTFFYTDNATKSTKFSLTRTEVGPENLHGVRLYQQAYLRKSTRQIGYRAVSWAPLLGDGSKGREKVVYKPVCWLPAFPAQDPRSLAVSDEIPYVFVTTTVGASPGMKDIQSLKGEMDWKGWLSDFFREPWAAAYAHDDDFIELNAEDMKQFETQESLLAMRFIVRWFWDDSRRMLLYEPVAWAPVGGVYDENGALEYRQALFWVKTGE